MASIGPQIPPHLLRRQQEDREEGNEEQEAGPSIGPSIPPSGPARPDEPEEEDDYNGAGPALPPELAAKRSQRSEERDNGSASRSIGPSLPPHLQSAPPEPVADDSHSDDYMPALPPDLQKPNSKPPATRSTTPPVPRPVAGPSAPPPQPQAQQQRRVVGPSFPTGPPDSDEEEIGPLPPSADDVLPERSGVEEFLELERRRAEKEKEAQEPKKLQREAWMLAPPTSSELLGSLDPTRLRSKRTLGGGSSAARGGEKEGLELWTETPLERLERLKAEVSGKRKRAGESVGMSAEEREEREAKRRRDEEIERRVQEHNKKSGRLASLVDMHASKEKGQKKNKKDEVIWDHERDMSIGGRLMDEGKRKDIIKDAKGLGGRFERGRTGGYL